MAAAMDGPETRLATYGTLAPGKVNHHQLDGMQGAWSSGWVRGRLVEEGWGAALGSPGLVLEQEGDEVAVDVFTSADLPAHWARLDAFEGRGYRRVVVSVRTEAGMVEASLYEIA